MRIAITVPAIVALSLAGIASAELAYGITQEQRLITFNTNSPDAVLSGVAISGLANNEVLMGLDVRPNDNLLYALGSQNNLYRVNPVTGAASLVGALSVPLNGTAFGFDFNPTGPVALRVVSNTDFNYRLPTPGINGDVIVDTPLAYVAGDSRFGTNPNITHVAYTNSVPGAMSTMLYAIDAGHDTLVRFGNANAGTLNTIGTLGMGLDTNINELGGFDISGTTGMAYAATRNVNLSASTLWGIDLATGQGVNLGEIGGGSVLVAFTVVPSPASLALIPLGGLLVSRRRR